MGYIYCTVRFVFVLRLITAVFHAKFFICGPITVIMYLFILGQILALNVPQLAYCMAVILGRCRESGQLARSQRNDPEKKGPDKFEPNVTSELTGSALFMVPSIGMAVLLSLQGAHDVSLFMSPSACDRPASVSYASYVSSYIVTFLVMRILGSAYDPALLFGCQFRRSGWVARSALLGVATCLSHCLSQY